MTKSRTLTKQSPFAAILGMHGLLLFGMLLGGCAGDPRSLLSSSNTSSDDAAQNAANAQPGARISFHHSDYYSLVSPNANSCAGDAKNFLAPLDYNTYGGNTLSSLGYGTHTTYAGSSSYSASASGSSAQDSGPVSFGLNSYSEPVKPDFIKAVSVDISDSNSTISQNNAASCSMGNGFSAPPPSQCATFDFGAIAGVSTSLGGSLFLMGGVQTENFSGYYTHQTPSSVPSVLPTPRRGVSLGCGPVDDTSTQSSEDYAYTRCDSTVYALGVDSLPPSVLRSSDAANLVPGLVGQTGITTSISSFVNLSANVSSSSGALVPNGGAGSSVAYSASLGRIAVFGGVAPASGQNAIGFSYDHANTYLYDIATQTWLSTTASVAQAPTTLSQQKDTSASAELYLSRAPTARAVFGYVAVPHIGIGPIGSSYDGNAAATINYSNRKDFTDQIMTIGGLTSDMTSAYTTAKNSYLFNPTFGPMFYDTFRYEGAAGAETTAIANTLVHWAQNYPYRVVNPLLENGTGTVASPYEPDNIFPKYSTVHFAPVMPQPAALPSPHVSPGPFLATNFGAAPIFYSAGGGSETAGGVMIAGGFNTSQEFIQDDFTSSATWAKDLPILYSARQQVGPAVHTDEESAPATLSWTAHDATGATRSPVRWQRLPAADFGTPVSDIKGWFGAGAFIQGFDKTTNDVVFFGGTNCQNYLLDGTLNSTLCKFRTTSLYLSVGSDEITQADPVPAVATENRINSAITRTVVDGTSPATAGMAAARGETFNATTTGTPVIVSFSGMTSGNVISSQVTSVLYKDTGTGNPTWVHIPPSGTTPYAVANAALVYSHITRKFYLYGGYRNTGLSGTQNSVWELTLSSTTSAPPFTATWRQLDNQGMTCNPECPGYRRSHRMVEVNYNNSDPTIEPDCTDATTPCSFAIFMEGGIDNNFMLKADRWMFDPTANGGLGHWQKVTALPPRHLASMSSVEYSLPGTFNTARRALLFGGETGLHSPSQAADGGNFVPPTLGDTWIFDFDSNTWNRVELAGKGYIDRTATFDDEFMSREAYQANIINSTNNYASLSLLSPPPLAGAMMVTRTYPSALKGATSTVEPLAIPEVFLFGGRTKDGKTNLLSNVYKFCMGSTGEKYPTSVNTAGGMGAQIGISNGATTDDATCDAYDADTNPNSLSPVSGYKGRWLGKYPAAATLAPSTSTATAPDGGAFLGAATYDPDHDKIVFYGGLTDLTGASTSIAVTDTSGDLKAIGGIMEYTPPSKVSTTATAAERNGSWKYIDTCTGVTAPTARYGHTLSYDPLNHNLIIVGGYDEDHALLTTSITYPTLSGYTPPSTTYTIPEVWTAKRIDHESEAPSGITLASTDVPCYAYEKKTTFGNTPYISNQAPPLTGIAFAAATFIQGNGYNTGYYTTMDNACVKAGPIATSDSTVNKLYAGGAYIDLERSALDKSENLLMHLRYIPLGVDNLRPDGNKFSSGEKALFRVHLMRTSMSADSISNVPQPRHIYYYGTDSFPTVAHSIGVFAPPTGEVREDQILLPISMDPSIDRIRIERESGSAILIDATVYRLKAH